MRENETHAHVETHKPALIHTPGRMSSLKSSHFDARMGGNLSMGGKLM